MMLCVEPEANNFRTKFVLLQSPLLTRYSNVLRFPPKMKTIYISSSRPSAFDADVDYTS